MPKKQDVVSSSGRSTDGVFPVTEFSLVKYFLLTCLGLFVIVTTVMCAGFYSISKRYIRTEAERRAVPVAERLARLAFVGGEPVPSPGTSAHALLDSRMRDVLRPLRIFKIKIYDADRRIVYTTDSRIQVGRVDAQNVKLDKAMAGQVVSSLQTEASVWDLDEEEKHIGTIVETYLPVFGGAQGGSSRGVLEIYHDVTATYNRLPAIIGVIVGASVLALGLLYGSLFLLIRKADNTIREQTSVIRRAKANMEQYASELESRVDERTRQLRESLAQQRQDDKMAAMGTLAAGIAHELNTPLGTILGSAQLLLDHCSSRVEGTTDKNQMSDSRETCLECVEDLGRIESQIKRCKEIIRNLVDFSRKSDSERSWEDLGVLTEQSIFLVKPEARQCGILVTTEIETDVPSVMVNGNEIQQVLVNIMNNAIAAMPNGGTLGVRVYRNGQVAVVEIRDTGMGIDRRKLARIFEPFFTTKEVGEGTGLGLSISFRIAKDHGGNILVSSVAGKGATFVLELPIDAERKESDEEIA